MAEHPSMDITAALGSDLLGKKIILGITGSVAAVKAPELARLLMRHGARVYPVMSRAATEIIHPHLMHWATGNEPVCKLTGAIEHIALAGDVEEMADLLLIAPATANTIGKIACGIDDTPVTTVATTALGVGIPVVIVPAMHECMYKHPLLKLNIEKLKEIGVILFEPTMIEGKAKIAPNEEILRCVRDILARKGALKGKRILITAGRTVEHIDPVRVITNNSSGKMGIALAESALNMGADVSLVYGKVSVELPSRAKLVKAETASKMKEVILNELKSTEYHAVIASAAVGDWVPSAPFKEKVSTWANESLTLELIPTPKIIDEIKKISPGVFLVAFRALYGLSKDQMIDDAFKRLKTASADIIAVNDVEGSDRGFESDTNELYVVDTDRRVVHIPLSSKREVASRIMEIVAERLNPKKKK